MPDLLLHTLKSQKKRLVDLMLNPTQLVKDVGTLLEGEEAVREGIIDEVGGIHQAFEKLYELIDEKREKTFGNVNIEQKNGI